ncbi:MAG: hypothetical protein EOP67_67800, partial [Sphingomonas sp.]
DAVMSTPWGANSPWSQHSLLAAYHNDVQGGEQAVLRPRAVCAPRGRHHRIVHERAQYVMRQLRGLGIEAQRLRTFSERVQFADHQLAERAQIGADRHLPQLAGEVDQATGCRDQRFGSIQVRLGFREVQPCRGADGRGRRRRRRR